MGESIWTEAQLPEYAPLRTSIAADVLVIGGGMAGLLCARLLQEAGVGCVVAERCRIAQGVTANTTAKLTAQHGLLYHKLLRQFGKEVAQGYLQANLSALDAFRAMSREIPCQFQELPAYLYSLEGAAPLQRELRALEDIGYRPAWESRPPLPFPVDGAVKFPSQGQFHPLQFLQGILPGLTIYENTPVLSLEGTHAVTPHGRIRAQKVIVATHFPFLNRHGAYFLKLFQERSYVLALENAGDVGGMYIDAKSGGLSLRNAGSALLLGGGSHRTGKKSAGWEPLRAFARQYYPASRERAAWATQDCITLDGIPYIGQYSPKLPDIYVATGFNKWGMTSSMVAAQLLKDAILARPNAYAGVFAPQRPMLRKQLLVNGWEASVNLLTPTRPRCPHLGCALKWNPQEHSWDCPCHGSRFAENGRLLNNPATGDLPPQE
ncbi:MAG TPA: FAD-dependent oxidoreductase [Candidatus Faecousia intestinigallinarum]|nr:FAD-dependent oxidoreductase [Candidatus Faecousia intestinigallinarum]